MARKRSAKSRREQDHFGKRAKKEGYAARSIYKLEEIDQRCGILSAGQRVLELGCSPGSWTAYAASQVGSTGMVVGYDLKPVNIALPPHAETRVGDVFELSPDELGGPFDVIISDMAPATMGDHKTDALRSAGLVECALELGRVSLVEGGILVAKLLEGSEIESLVRRMRGEFKKVQRLRPKATRKESTEVFLVGMGKYAVEEDAGDGE